MSEIKVSVIIPVYNTEKYLYQCLDSVLNQTLQDIEVICVDDGSTDNSSSILDEYAGKDKRLKVFHQQNRYAGVARNRGLEIAQGEYLYFLDSDDFIEDTLLEKTYAQAKIVGDADVVLFGGKKYNEAEGKYKEAPYLLRRNLLLDQSVFSRADFSGSLLCLTTPCPWTKLFRRSFVEEQGLCFQSFRNSNDVFFVFVSLSLAKVITYVDEELVYYRVGQGNNLQSNKDEFSTCFVDAYESVYHELIKRGVYSDVEKGFVAQTLSGCAYNLNTVKSNESKMRICERLNSPSFTEMGLLDHPDDYYPVLEDMQRVRGTKKAVEWKGKFINPKDPDFHSLIDFRPIDIAPAVSVIIPVYNTEPWLGPCLDSILNQTLRNIEILCVDDGSTDQSRDILLKYAAEDNRIAVYAQNNSGMSVVRNRGVEQARGKYIYFMDSDDLLDEDALEKLTQQADQYDLEILCFNGETFADMPELEPQLDRFNYFRSFSYVNTPVNSGEDLYVQMKQNNEYKCSVCLFLVCREFLLSSGIRFYSGIIHEDEIYTFELLLSARRVGCTTETFLHRRLREKSAMTTETTFIDAYGYFICYLETASFADRIDVQGTTAELVWNRPNEMLHLARRYYSKLPIDEREAFWGLPVEQQSSFQLLVVEYCDQQGKTKHQEQDVKRMQSQLEQQKTENKSLQNKLIEQESVSLNFQNQLKNQKFEYAKLEKQLKDQKSDNTKLQKQLKDVKNSRSYRLGHALLWPVRICRSAWRRLRNL